MPDDKKLRKIHYYMTSQYKDVPKDYNQFVSELDDNKLKKIHGIISSQFDDVPKDFNQFNLDIKQEEEQQSGYTWNEEKPLTEKQKVLEDTGISKEGSLGYEKKNQQILDEYEDTIFPIENKKEEQIQEEEKITPKYDVKVTDSSGQYTPPESEMSQEAKNITDKKRNQQILDEYEDTIKKLRTTTDSAKTLSIELDPMMPEKEKFRNTLLTQTSGAINRAFDKLMTVEEIRNISDGIKRGVIDKEEGYKLLKKQNDLFHKIEKANVQYWGLQARYLKETIEAEKEKVNERRDQLVARKDSLIEAEYGIKYADAFSKDSSGRAIIDFEKLKEYDKAKQTLSEEYYNYNNKMSFLRDASDMLTQTIQLSEAPEASWEGKNLFQKILNFNKVGAEGFFNGPIARDFWTLGFNEIQRYYRLSEIAGKMREGQPISETEEAVMASYALMTHMSQVKDPATSYQVGTIMAEMIPYIIQFALTDGSATIVQAAVKKGISKTIKLGVGRYIGDVIGFSSRALPQMGVTPMMYSDYFRRRTGDVELEPGATPMELGIKLIKGSEETPGQAAWNAAATSWAEFTTERFGDVGQLWTKGLKKGRWFKALDDKFFSKVKITNPIIKSIAKATAYNGAGWEYIEELANGYIQAALTGDKKMSEVWDNQEQLEIALSVVGMGVGFMAMNKVGSAISGKANLQKDIDDFHNVIIEASKKRMETAHEAMSDVLKAKVEEINKKIKNPWIRYKKIAEELTKIFKDESLSEEDKINAWKYYTAKFYGDDAIHDIIKEPLIDYRKEQKQKKAEEKEEETTTTPKETEGQKETKGKVIYGSPGSGKTFLAKQQPTKYTDADDILKSILKEKGLDSEEEIKKIRGDKYDPEKHNFDNTFGLIAFRNKDKINEEFTNRIIQETESGKNVVGSNEIIADLADEAYIIEDSGDMVERMRSEGRSNKAVEKAVNISNIRKREARIPVERKKTLKQGEYIGSKVEDKKEPVKEGVSATAKTIKTTPKKTKEPSAATINQKIKSINTKLSAIDEQISDIEDENRPEDKEKIEGLKKQHDDLIKERNTISGKAKVEDEEDIAKKEPSAKVKQEKLKKDKEEVKRKMKKNPHRIVKKEFPPKKDEEKSDEFKDAIKKHKNYKKNISSILSDISLYNSRTKYKKGTKEGFGIFQRISKATAEAGWSKNTELYLKQNPTTKKITLHRKSNNKKVVLRTEVDNTKIKILSEYDYDFINFVKNAVFMQLDESNYENIISNLSLPSVRNKKQAARNLIEGKRTVELEALLDDLMSMYKSGGIEYIDTPPLIIDKEYYDDEYRYREVYDNNNAFNFSTTEPTEEAKKENAVIDKAIENLKNVKEKLDKFGKENLGINIPVAIARVAVATLETSLRAGKNIAEAIKDAISAVKKTGWYQRLNEANKLDIDKKIPDFLSSTLKGESKEEELDKEPIQQEFKDKKEKQQPVTETELPSEATSEEDDESGDENDLEDIDNPMFFSDPERKQNVVRKKFRDIIMGLKRTVGLMNPEQDLIGIARAFTRMVSESGYKKEEISELFDKILEGKKLSTDVRRTIEYLKDIDPDIIVSLFASYGSSRINPVKILTQKGTSKIKILNANTYGTYSKLETTVSNTIDDFEYVPTTGKNKGERQKGGVAFYEAWREYYAKRNEVGKNRLNEDLTGEQKLQQHRIDLDFLKLLTGVDWTDYFNSTNEKVYIRLPKSDRVEKLSYDNYEKLLSSIRKIYRRTKKGGDRVFLKHESDFIYNFSIPQGRNKLGVADIFTPAEGNYEVIKERVKNYFLSQETDESESNLRKLANMKKDEGYATDFNFNNKRQPSIEFISNMILTAELLRGKSEWYRKNGVKLERVIGMQNTEYDNAVEAGKMNPNDIMLANLVMFRTAIENGSYMQYLGQFGDKSRLQYINSPTYIIAENKEHEDELLESFQGIVLSKQEANEKIKEVFADVKDPIKEFNETVKEIVMMMNENASSFIDFQTEKEKYAKDFLLNYIINKKYLTEYLNGNIEQYSGETLFEKYVNMIKRGSSLASPGIAPDVNLKGGVGKFHRHAILNDPKYNEIKKVFDGMIFSRQSFLQNLGNSYGEVLTRSKEFPFYTTSKLLLDHTNDENRILIKSNIISIDLLAQVFGGLFQDLSDLMYNEKIDVVSFPSSAKLTGGNAVNEKFDGLEINESPVFTFDYDNTHIFLQQDLRSSIVPKLGKNAKQEDGNFINISESDIIAELTFDLQNKNIASIISKMKSNNEINDYILDNINEDQMQNLADYLRNNGTKNHPVYTGIMSKILSSYIRKNVLEKQVNRVKLQSVLDPGNIHDEMQIVDSKVILGEASANIQGARAAQFFNSKEEAIAAVKKDPGFYKDLFTEGTDFTKSWNEIEGNFFLQEIRIEDKEVKDKGKWKVPGEFIMATRVPSDNFHTHSMVRLKYKFPGDSNVIMINKADQLSAGEDGDGDARYCKVLFKKKGVLSEAGRPGLSNRIFLKQVAFYYDPANMEIIKMAIDLDMFNSTVDRKRNEKHIARSIYNPYTDIDAYKNNNVGRQVIGIAALLMTTFDFAKKHKLFLKKSVKFGKYELSTIAEDRFGVVKSAIGNILNLALDNAKDPKIEIININEVTIPIVVLGMIFNPAIDKINTIEGQVKYIQDYIDFVADYFDQDMQGDFIRLEREKRMVGKSYTSKDTFERLINKYGKQKMDAFKAVYYAGKELSKVSNFIKSIYESPTTTGEYISLNNTIEDIKTNSLRNIDVSGFKRKETEQFTDHVAISEVGLRYAFEYNYEKNIEFSAFGNILIKSLVSPNDMNQVIDRYVNNIRKIATLKAINNGQSLYAIELDLKDVINNKEEYKNKRTGEANAFLNNITIGRNGIIRIAETYRTDVVPDDVLKQIHKDFDQLPNDIKRKFSIYNLAYHNMSISTYGGSYFNLISNDYNVKISNAVEYQMRKWNKKDIDMSLVGDYASAIKMSVDNNYRLELPENVWKFLAKLNPDILKGIYYQSINEAEIKTSKGMLKLNIFDIKRLKGYMDLAESKWLSSDEKKDGMKLKEYLGVLTESKQKPSPKAKEGIQIKEGVSELFESNPELANAVYESLGFNQSNVEEFKGFWNRQQVTSQTKKVFLFGDNTNDRTVTKYVPSITQAVIRGLSNAIGIDTKKDRGTSTSSYLTDNDFEWFKSHVDTQIQQAKNSGKTIVIPADGIGTGKAMLKEKAPKLFEYLQQEINKLKEQQITPQQKQQAQQQYSEYLDTVFPEISSDKAVEIYNNILGKLDNEDTKGEGFIIYPKNLNFLKNAINEKDFLEIKELFTPFLNIRWHIKFDEHNNKLRLQTNNSNLTKWYTLKGSTIPNKNISIHFRKDSKKTPFETKLASSIDRSIQEPHIDSQLSTGYYFWQDYNIILDNFKYNAKNFINHPEWKDDVTVILSNVNKPYIANNGYNEKVDISGAIKELKELQKLGLLNPKYLQIIEKDEKIKKEYGEKIDFKNYPLNKIPNGLLQYMGYDSVVYPKNKEINIFNKEQIHILGGKQDIEGFKEFVQNKQSDTDVKLDNLKKGEVFDIVFNINGKEVTSKVKVVDFFNQGKNIDYGGQEDILEIKLENVNNGKTYIIEITVNGDVKSLYVEGKNIDNPNTKIIRKKQPPKAMNSQEVGREKLATADQAMEDAIAAHLSEIFPEVEVFTDREKFADFVEKNGGDISKFSLDDIGSAFENAVFIDPKLAVQSTKIHEYAHIYWDLLPEDDQIKKKLIKLFGSEEDAILNIGRIGFNEAEVLLSGTTLQKFKSLLKLFWARVMKFFGIAGKNNLSRVYFNNMWNKIHSMDTKTRNAVMVRNMKNQNKDEVIFSDVDGEGNEAHVYRWKPTNEVFISVTTALQSIKNSIFNKYAYADKMISAEADGKEMTEREKTARRKHFFNFFEAQGRSGTYIHRTNEVNENGDLLDVTDEYIDDAYQSERIFAETRKQMQDFIDKIKDKYPGAKFYSEEIVADPVRKIAGRVDFMVEIEPGRVILIDFKTSTKSFYDEDGNLAESYSYSFSKYKHPLNSIIESKKADHTIQLNVYGNILEGTTDVKVEKIFVLPIKIAINPNTYKIYSTEFQPLIEISRGDRQKAIATQVVESVNEYQPDSELEKYLDIIYDRQMAGYADKYVLAEMREAIMYLTRYAGDLSAITAENVHQLTGYGGLSNMAKYIMEELGYKKDDIKAMSAEQFYFVRFGGHNNAGVKKSEYDQYFLNGRYNGFLKNKDEFEVYAHHYDVEYRNYSHYKRSIEALRRMFDEIGSRSELFEVMKDENKINEYRDRLSKMNPVLVFNLWRLFQENIFAHSIAKRIRMENDKNNYDIKPFTLHLYKHITLPKDRYYLDFAAPGAIKNILGDRYVTTKTPALQVAVIAMSDALREAEYHNWEVQDTFEKIYKRLKKVGFDEEDLIIEKDGNRYFRKPEDDKIKEGSDQQEILELIYDTYAKYNLTYNIKDRILVPSSFANFKELKRMTGGRLYAIRAQRYLAPTPFDNIIVKHDNEGNPVRYIDVKRKVANDIINEGNKASRKNLRMNIPLARTELKEMYEKAKDIHKQRSGNINDSNNSMRIVRPLMSKNVLIETEDSLEAALKHMQSTISAYYMRDAIPIVEKIKDSMSGSKTPKASYWLRKQVDVLMYNYNGEDRFKDVEPVIAALIRLKSLNVMWGSIRTQIFNFGIGQVMDAIYETKNYAVGIARIMKNPSDIRKAIALAKRFGIGNVTEDISLRKNFNTMEFFEKIGYKPMDVTEKANQIPLLIGALTKEQWKAYDVKNGRLIIVNQEKALTNTQIRSIAWMIRGVHGDYGVGATAPWLNTVAGRTLFQFKKWAISYAAMQFSPYYIDANMQAQIGTVPSVHNLAIITGFNIIKTLGIVKGLTASKYNDLTKRMKDAEQNKGVYEELMSLKLIDRLILDSEGGKILWKDIPLKLRKQVFSAAKLLTALTVVMFIFYAMGGDDDDDDVSWWHKNVWVPFFTRLTGDMIPFYDPDELNNLAFSNIGAIFSYLTNAVFMLSYMGQAMVGSENAVYASGENEGEYKFINRLFKVVPGGSAGKQFMYYIAPYLGWSDEKDKYELRRMLKKYELLEKAIELDAKKWTKEQYLIIENYNKKKRKAQSAETASKKIDAMKKIEESLKNDPQKQLVIDDILRKYKEYEKFIKDNPEEVKEFKEKIDKQLLEKIE